MQTKVAPSPELSLARREYSSGWHGLRTLDPSFAVFVLLPGAAIVALFVLGAAGWLLGAWAGIAVVGSLFAVASLVVAVHQVRERARDRSVFESLVASLNQPDNLNVANFRLGPRWAPIAQRLIDSHNAWARQERERQVTTQKVECSQRANQAAHWRAEAVVDSLGDAILVTNTFGEFLLANPEAERLFQVQIDQIRGKPLRAVVKNEALAKLVEQSAERGPGTRRHTEELSIASNGKTRWYKVTTSTLIENSHTHQESELQGIVTVLRDITSEKAAQARSAEFISAVSHEIKTPLASVKAYVEMLADGDASGDPETQQKFLGIIETQTDRMTRLLESMLDLARIESGVVRVEKKVVSLGELIENGAKLMQPAASEKNIAITTQLSPLFLGVEVDSDMMSRVVMNLVSNAIKYTDGGGRITLHSKMLEDQAMLAVEDTGRGIPAEAMGKLFQRFYRVKENSSMAHGTGLGLSLVKHIVEEVHGGTIEVDSQVGKGSTFRAAITGFRGERRWAGADLAHPTGFGGERAQDLVNRRSLRAQ
ncbi:MAG: PAS domain S-box protein [Planctomycetes bacterium]|nr:PAS domain S-box protein [Planctomycetota bacterium]